ncbi:hypothetical protein pipiens_018254 [Culex pipiens pipiens]|uniref:Uncharacterized protein n=1 Tax=Culex pipiens pipiens TaxID=38569 RepID=A0ABD1CCP9_CULPP
MSFGNFACSCLEAFGFYNSFAATISSAHLKIKLTAGRILTKRWRILTTASPALKPALRLVVRPALRPVSRDVRAASTKKQQFHHAIRIT